MFKNVGDCWFWRFEPFLTVVYNNFHRLWDLENIYGQNMLIKQQLSKQLNHLILSQISGEIINI